MIGPGAVRRAQRRRRLAASDPVHLAEGAWAELRATALDLGLDWPEQRSPREQARSVVRPGAAPSEDVASLEGLLVRGRARPLRPRRGRSRTRSTRTTRARTVETVESWRKVMLGSVAAGARLAGSAVAGVAGARIGWAVALRRAGSAGGLAQ